MYPIRDESEDIIIQLAKRQRKMSNYSDEENLSYSSRESLLEWCNKVLDSLELSLLEKESIFHVGEKESAKYVDVTCDVL